MAFQHIPICSAKARRSGIQCRLLLDWRFIGYFPEVVPVKQRFNGETFTSSLAANGFQHPYTRPRAARATFKTPIREVIHDTKLTNGHLLRVLLARVSKRDARQGQLPVA